MMIRSKSKKRTLFVLGLVVLLGVTQSAQAWGWKERVASGFIGAAGFAGAYVSTVKFSTTESNLSRLMLFGSTLLSTFIFVIGLRGASGESIWDVLFPPEDKKTDVNKNMPSSRDDDRLREILDKAQSRESSNGRNNVPSEAERREARLEDIKRMENTVD